MSSHYYPPSSHWPAQSRSSSLKSTSPFTWYAKQLNQPMVNPATGIPVCGSIPYNLISFHDHIRSSSLARNQTPRRQKILLLIPSRSRTSVVPSKSESPTLYWCGIRITFSLQQRKLPFCPRSDWQRSCDFWLVQGYRWCPFSRYRGCTTWTNTFIPTANGIVTKDIHTKTLSGAPVTVVCDPTVIVLSLLDVFRHWLCISGIDLDWRGVQMLGWPFPANMSRIDTACCSIAW